MIDIHEGPHNFLPFSVTQQDFRTSEVTVMAALLNIWTWW